MFKLNDDDGRAVDMLLDTTGSSNGNGSGVKASPAPFRERLESVESILNLLKEMPHTDPPKDLLAKTLRVVERRGKKRPAKFAPSQPDQPQNRPLA